MNKPDRYEFPPKVLHITVIRGFQLYDEKAYNMKAELQQLVHKKLFAPVEALKVLPAKLKKAVRSSMFPNENFIQEYEFMKHKV